MRGSAGQTEVDSDDGGNVGGLAVDEVGTVAPAADGVLGGAAEQVRTLEDAGGFYGAVAGNDDLDDDFPFDVGEAGEFGIAGRGGVKEMGSHHAGRGEKDAFAPAKDSGGQLG